MPLMKLDAASLTGAVVRVLESSMTFGNGMLTTVDGFATWDFDHAYLERDDGGAVVIASQFYTQCAWIKRRQSNDQWRTCSTL